MYKIIKFELEIAEDNEGEISQTIVAHNINTYEIAYEISKSYEKIKGNDRTRYVVDRQRELIKSEIISPFDDEFPF